MKNLVLNPGVVVKLAADWFVGQGMKVSKVVAVLDWSDDAGVYEYIKRVV